MIPAAQLGQMVAPSIVTTTLVAGVSGSAVVALQANPKRRRAILQNLGASTGGVGDSTVITTTGFALTAFSATNPNCQMEIFDQGVVYWGGTTGQNLLVMEFLVP